MKILRTLLTCTLVVILSGFATLFETSALAANQPITRAQREFQLNRISRWRTSGALSISFRGKTDMGSFVWNQYGRGFDFRTYGPLNVAGMRIAGRPGHVTLWRNNQHTITAPSAEILLKRQTGWYLPLSNLRYWSRGLAAPGLKTRKRYDQWNRLSALAQQGWTIYFQRYQNINGWVLPRSIVMVNHGLQVKIVFKDWRL